MKRDQGEFKTLTFEFDTVEKVDGFFDELNMAICEKSIHATRMQTGGSYRTCD
jgi:hypothetical protein